MSVEIALNTPLADALGAAIISKIGEMALGSGADESSLSEYIILMLVNGKDEAQIASELSTELLGLEPDDPSVREFSRWLFNHVRQLNQQFSNPSIPMPDQAMFTHGVSHEGAQIEMDTDMSLASPNPEINAPTGPRSMRNGNGSGNVTGRGGRDKRMLGHINKAMDRSHDALHRVRIGSGNERINSHGRGPPTGPRGNNARLPRAMNNRAASIAHGIVAHGMNGMGGVPQAHTTPGMDGMPNMNGQWGMAGPGQAPQQFNVMNMLEQQGRIIQELHKQQQMMLNRDQGGRGGFRGRGSGRNDFRRGGNHHNTNQNGRSQQHIDTSIPISPPEGEDVDMSQGKAPSNPEEMVCKFNGRCTNKDCKFAHQTPAVPPTMNVTVDVNDVCSFGAACKNRKCVGRHPSPAARFAHQSEQDCKFYPNCANPKCPFRHPPPICRNGGDCTVPNCKFTHLQTPCKYNPCTNRFCGYKHEEGQRGTFQDKVWTSDSTNKEHVSERKFVDEHATEETVMVGAEAEMEAIG